MCGFGASLVRVEFTVGWRQKHCDARACARAASAGKGSLRGAWKSVINLGWAAFDQIIHAVALMGGASGEGGCGWGASTAGGDIFAGDAVGRGASGGGGGIRALGDAGD